MEAFFKKKHPIGCSKVATKRHFIVVVAICTNSVQTDYLIKCTKLAVLDFFGYAIKKMLLNKVVAYKKRHIFCKMTYPKKFL